MSTHPKWIMKYVHNSKVSAVRIVNWEDHHQIATITDVYTHNGEKSEGMEAAELIAAAPEMLDALKTAARDLEMLLSGEADNTEENTRATLETIRAAIEKAQS